MVSQLVFEFAGPAAHGPFPAFLVIAGVVIVAGIFGAPIIYVIVRVRSRKLKQKATTGDEN